MVVSFRGLLIWGLAITACALGILIGVIPWVGRKFEKSNSRTDFRSAQAAYWVVVSGLVLVVASGIGSVIAQVIAASRGK